MVTLRTIEHDGGLFTFVVPAGWSHETEDDGTQVFWDECAGSGTLRVTALTLHKEVEGVGCLPQFDLLSNGAVPSLRDDGVAWVHFRREESEDGQPTIMFWWEFAHFIAPCYGRIAFFSFTIYAGEEHHVNTQTQVQALNRLATAVEFGPLQQFEQR